MEKLYKEIYVGILLQVLSGILKNGHALNLEEIHRTTTNMTDFFYAKLQNDPR